jgi:DNA repair protein RecN (Recombination protein N)
LRHLEELAKYEPKFAEPAQALAAAKAAVEDVSAEVRDFADRVQAKPERLEEIEDRLAVLDKLKRKYGVSLGEVVRFGEDAARRLAEVENRDAMLAALRMEQERDAAAYLRVAVELTAARTAAAGRLEKLAAAQINDLAMSVRFKVEVEAEREVSGWSAHGWDEIDYLIATNAGEPLKRLEEIASGGEMSRVMLALKVTVEDEAAGKRKKKTVLPRTLVFDEIDIGIGGRAAEAVGQKLKTLSGGQQVLCITHLPQIAAFADQHFLIAKTERGGRTQTEVRRMEQGERIEEIARMLSGAKLTETSMKHAQHLVETSR